MGRVGARYGLQAGQLGFRARVTDWAHSPVAAVLSLPSGRAKAFPKWTPGGLEHVPRKRCQRLAIPRFVVGLDGIHCSSRQFRVEGVECPGQPLAFPGPLPVYGQEELHGSLEEEGGYEGGFLRSLGPFEIVKKIGEHVPVEVEFELGKGFWAGGDERLRILLHLTSHAVHILKHPAQAHAGEDGRPALGVAGEVAFVRLGSVHEQLHGPAHVVNVSENVKSASMAVLLALLLAWILDASLATCFQAKRGLLL